MVHILFWNPDISSVTRQRMADEMPYEFEVGGAFNWSFWEYEDVKPGDECYMVRCSDSTGPHGIMLHGRIISEPYQSEDWSGRGRTIYYADWNPLEFIDTEEGQPLSPETLEKHILDFNWRGGHSGRPLPKHYEEILQKLWYDHIKELTEELDEVLFVNHFAYQLPAATLDFWKKINKNLG